MTDRIETEAPWQWWAGSNEELFGVGPEATREDALAAAINDGLGETLAEDGVSYDHHIHLVEAQNAPLRLADWVDVEDMIERADESLCESDRANPEYGDEGPFFAPTPEQRADLATRIKAAINDWQDAHKIVVTTNTFSATRNAEFIVVPAEKDADQ